MILYWPEDLRISFEQFGLIEDVYLPKDYYTGYNYFSFYISVCVFVMLFVIKYLESSTYSKIYIYILLLKQETREKSETPTANSITCLWYILLSLQENILLYTYGSWHMFCVCFVSWKLTVGNWCGWCGLKSGLYLL